MRPIHNSPHLLIVLSLPSLVSCQSTEDTTTITAAITDVVPTSDECNQGIGPMNCVHAAPITTEVPRWKVDGVKEPQEYNGATSLPYTMNMPTLGGNGKVLVQRVTDPKTASPLPKDAMYVLLDQLPVPLLADGKTPMGRIDIYVDHVRFDGATKYATTTEDRRLELDLKLEKVTTSKVTGSGATLNWTPTTDDPGFEFRSGGCEVVPHGGMAWCTGELKIPLPDSAVTPPGDGLQPGIGIFVRHAEVTAGMPELASTKYTPAMRDRTLWQTLLFGPPRGFPLRVMSWNVNRDEDDIHFDDVKDEEIGKFLAHNDIVALQEVWTEESAEAILKAANEVRTKDGLPLYQLYGPVDFDPSWRDLILSLADWVEETHGGLYVLSHLNIANEGTLVFPSSDCRGNDCFRAKGVQWLRFILNDPATANPNCREGTEHCAKPPSGDDYFDLFNLHLQNDDTPMCEPGTWDTLEPVLVAAIEAIVPEPWGLILVAALEAGVQLVEADMNCRDDRSDGDFRKTQLVLANDFIKKISTAQRDRPSIVVGDFNIDGKNIDNDEYEYILQELEISEGGSPGDDAITVNPAYLTDDVDHGDIARERSDIDFKTGLCLGTTIGIDDGTSEKSCVNDGLWDGHRRTSYILVRPYAPLSIAKTLSDPRWYAQKGAMPWSSPFPSNTGGTGAPPERLSDHKPVVADVILTPLSYLPKYHPGWKHNAGITISSVQASHIDDCAGCNEVDPYAKLEQHVFPGPVPMKSKHTDECSDKAQISWPTDTCMMSWGYTHWQDVNENGFRLRAEIWEDDDGGGDNDALSIFTESKLTYDTGNGEGAFDFRLEFLSNSFSHVTYKIVDTSTIGRCDKNLAAQHPLAGGMARVCHRMWIYEEPPLGP